MKFVLEEATAMLPEAKRTSASVILARAASRRARPDRAEGGSDFFYHGRFALFSRQFRESTDRVINGNPAGVCAVGFLVLPKDETVREDVMRALTRSNISLIRFELQGDKVHVRKPT
jgi:hypothetical protein